MGTAIVRLDGLGLTRQNLDKWISEAAGIPVESVELAVLDYSDYELGLASAGRLDTTNLEERLAAAIDDTASEGYWETSYRVKSADLGPLPTLRKIRFILETTPPEAIVYLDLCYTADWPAGRAELERFRILTIDYDGRTQLRRNYLARCRIHYVTREYDLVYIELVIALEAEIEAYLASRFGTESGVEEQRRTHAEEIIRNIPLIGLTRFIIEVLEARSDVSQLIADVEKVYNIRNNIIHKSQRRFEIPAVYRSIEAIERMVSVLRGFHPAPTSD
ncbi:MAG TPA: hypothetical protein VFG07_07260 [Thermoplasmata archaeon]|nr:hypothetical protein [Thermoplasmata archaeon]